MPLSGIGTICRIAVRASSVAVRSATMGVAIIPGATALRGMPAPAHSGVDE